VALYISGDMTWNLQIRPTAGRILRLHGPRHNDDGPIEISELLTPKSSYIAWTVCKVPLWKFGRYSGRSLVLVRGRVATDVTVPPPRTRANRASPPRECLKLRGWVR
jgi:hypothetical protein